MNLRRLTARAAVVGVVASGAIVGFGATAANAAEVSNTYTCTTALGNVDATLTVAGDLPVDSYWAGAPVPAGLVPVTASVDPTTAGLLVSVLHATGLAIDDFAFGLGSSSVPEPLSGAISGGSWAGSGTNEAFLTGAPGVTAVTMPAAMTVTALVGDTPVPLPCVLKDGQTAATIASITLVQQQSSTTVPAKVKARKGKAASFPATVKSTSTSAPVTSGKVVAKEGKKVVGTGQLNSKGIAKINLSKKLKKGKHKLSVVYAGTKSIKGSKAATTLVVR